MHCDDKITKEKSWRCQNCDLSLYCSKACYKRSGHSKKLCKHTSVYKREIDSFAKILYNPLATGMVGAIASILPEGSIVITNYNKECDLFADCTTDAIALFYEAVFSVKQKKDMLLRFVGKYHGCYLTIKLDVDFISGKEFSTISNKFFDFLVVWPELIKRLNYNFCVVIDQLKVKILNLDQYECTFCYRDGQVSIE